MRLAFFVLLLANLILFVWGQGYWNTPEIGREPKRLQQQIDPGKLRILPAETTAAAHKVAPVVSCKRIEWLSSAEAETLAAAVASLPDWKSRLQPRKEDPTHWVLIPELPNRAAAEKKRAELRQLGVNESEVVEDAAQGPFVVSLGVFRSQPLAEEHLRSLAKKGVRSAKLGKREMPTTKFALEVSAPAGEIADKLPVLIANLPQIGTTDCAATAAPAAPATP